MKLKKNIVMYCIGSVVETIDRWGVRSHSDLITLFNSGEKEYQYPFLALSLGSKFRRYHLRCDYRDQLAFVYDFSASLGHSYLKLTSQRLFPGFEPVGYDAFGNPRYEKGYGSVTLEHVIGDLKDLLQKYSQYETGLGE